MSGITFPAPPHTNGDTHIAENGVIYTWQDGGWMANQVSGLDDTYVNRKGDDMTGDLTVPSLNGGQLAGFRNQLINGDFRVWQRGTNVTNQISSTKSVYLSADRWALFNQSGTQNVRVARNGNPIAEAPATYSMQLDNATVALKNTRFIQGVELTGSGYPDAFTVGTTWTLSVYSDTDLTSRTPGYGFADDTTRTNNVGGGSIESWQSLGGNRYKATFTIDVSPSSSNVIFYIIDAPPVGSTRVNYTCWQLEPGPVATPFEHRPIGTELALCQRYYWTSASGDPLDNSTDTKNNNMLTPQTPNTNSGVFEAARVPFPVTMRSQPTCTYLAPSGATNKLWVNPSGDIDVRFSRPQINWVSTTALAAGNFICGIVKADAEL